MNTTIKHSMGWLEWSLLILLSLAWGGSFFFVEIVIDDLAPLTIVFIRVALGAMFLWTFVLARGLRLPRSSETWLAFLVMGLINNVIPFVCIVWGQTFIASGLAAILNATTPLFTVVVAGTLLADERINAAKLAGVLAGFAGVILMIGPDLLQGINDNLLAQLAILAAAISYAFAGVYGRRFRRLEVNPVVTAAGQVGASTLLMTPLVFWLQPGTSWSLPEAGGIAALLGLGLVSTAMAYIMYFRILATAGATNLLLVTFLVPVSAILLGSLVLGEQLAGIHFIGMALIGCGLAFIDGRPMRVLFGARRTPDQAA